MVRRAGMVRCLGSWYLVRTPNTTPNGYRRRFRYRVLLIGITFSRTRLLCRLRPRRASSSLPRTACLTSEPERGARSSDSSAPMLMPTPRNIRAVFVVSVPSAALLYSPYFSYWFIAFLMLIKWPCLPCRANGNLGRPSDGAAIVLGLHHEHDPPATASGSVISRNPGRRVCTSICSQ